MKAIDTENIIHNRHRVRIASVINISLVFITLAIKDYFTQPHASWVHLLHFLFQPMLLILSMLDDIYIIQCGLYGSLFVLVIDLFVFFLNSTAISRCFVEPTATCFDRLWESAIWIVLSLFFSFLDILNAFQLYNLIQQIKKKQNFRLNPYDTMSVNERKMSVLHIYCLPQDIIFLIITVVRSSTIPIFWIGAIHLFVDPYVIWYGKTDSKETFSFRRIIYICLLAVNITLFILNLQIPDKGILEWISLFIVGSYVCIDVALMVLVEEVLITFKSFKSS